MQIAPAQLDAAKEQIELGNLGFRVITSATWSERRMFFYITTPFTLRKNRWRDRLANKFLSIGGEATDRGKQLFDALRTIPGVEPSLDDMNRQLLVLSIKEDLFPQESTSLMRSSLQGLPLSVAIVIQSVCMD